MMAGSDAEVLAALDFTPSQPRCECRSCKHHYGTCARTAVFSAQVHLFGDCKQPGLTPNGAATEMLCPLCVLARNRSASDLVEQSHTYRASLGAFISCTTCDREIINTSDIWEVRKLDG